MPIDPLKELAPITRRLHRYHPAGGERPAPVEDFSELVAAAKHEPGKITMGSSGTGTVSHLEMELLKRVADVDITHVPYRGGGPAFQDLYAGNIDMMFDVIPARCRKCAKATSARSRSAAPSASPMSRSCATCRG